MGYENLGIESLASYLEQNGHQTQLIFDPALFDDKHYFENKFLANLFKYKTIVKDIINTNPDVVLFSVFSDCNQWALDIARKIKKNKNIPIIFGGIHPTSIPQKTIQEACIDYVVVGESEDALLELLNSLENNKSNYSIPNIWFKKDGKIISNPVRSLRQDLDALPYPNKDLFVPYVPLKEYMIATVRGCLFACSFCCHNYLRRLYKDDNQRYVRRRSPENVIGELKIAKQKYNFNVVSFIDDIFTYDKEYLRKFLPLYKKEIDIPFVALAHPLYVDDEIAMILKQSGCTKLQIGIQTFNEVVKRKMMSRIETNDDIIRAIKACNKYNLNFIVDHMFGFGETDEEIKYAVLLYNKYRPVRINCYWLQYYPSTTVIQKTKATEEQIKEAEEGKQNTYFTGGSVKDKNSIKLIKNYQFIMKSLQIWPKCMVKFFIKSKIYKFFHFIHTGPFEIFVAIKTNDNCVFNYVSYYTFNFKKLLKKKLDSIRTYI